ncbi:lipase family protein, partial [Ligilactobacillus salitolerans]|uniref:lipase family protein n=1 Tax=Ligilactobacillus salitolerans TaxID=1808352 RepID=UPI001E2F794A
MHRLHPGFDPQKATYTGHSLGASLATYAAVHYDAKATVFSAPSAYNELIPQQRAQVRQGKFNKKIKNIKHANDIVPDLPGLVPPIGKQVYIFNKNSLPSSLSDLAFTMINAAGHLTKTFSPDNFDESGAAIAVSELTGAILHAQANRYSLGLGINLTINYFDLVRKEYSTSKRLAAKLQSSITDTAKQVKMLANRSVQAEKIALQKDSVDAAIASLKASKEPLKNIKKIN